MLGLVLVGASARFSIVGVQRISVISRHSYACRMRVRSFSSLFFGCTAYTYETIMQTAAVGIKFGRDFMAQDCEYRHTERTRVVECVCYRKQFGGKCSKGNASGLYAAVMWNFSAPLSSERQRTNPI